MSLLVRGIKTNNQGLGALDAAIAKKEADKAVFESNVSDFNTLLLGYESDSNYLGKKSKTILNEYASAFEKAIDAYSADPSEENKRRVEELKLITTDFYNKAVAARKNSLAQLQSVIQSPTAYRETLSQAQQMFAEAEDADVTAQFDPLTNQMYISQGDIQNMIIGEDGYYNGENPLFFTSRNKFGEIKGEGSWADENGDRYINIIGQDAVTDELGNVVTKSGRDRVIDAFVETGIYDSSPYQDTAIYNYINDVKGVKLETLRGEEGMRQLEQMIFDIKQDPAELEMALRYYGGLEADYVSGMASKERSEAQQARYNELFSGQVTERPLDPNARPQLTGTYQDRQLGAYYVDMFTGVGYDSSQMAGLEENEQLRGFNMLSDGSMVVYIDRKLVEIDEDTGEEIPLGTEQEFRVIGPDSDLYLNIENEVRGTGVISEMIDRSIRSQKAKESRENARIINGYYERDEIIRRGGSVDTSGLTEEQLRTATTPQFTAVQEAQQEREEEIRRSGSVRQTEAELAMNRVPPHIRDKYYTEDKKKEGSDEFYEVPENALFRGTGNNQKVVVDGEVIGEYVSVFDYSTGKYRGLGMRPQSRSAVARFIDGVMRFFSPEESEQDVIFEYSEEGPSQVGAEEAQNATPPEQREEFDALSPEMRSKLQEVSTESVETISNLSPEIKNKVEERIGNKADVFVKLEPNSDNTADLVIFVDSLGQELAIDPILVERE